FILSEVELLMISTTSYGSIISGGYLPYVPLETKGWGAFPEKSEKILIKKCFSLICFPFFVND
ncbi:MAG: hypothetical protein O0V67_07465, partial [Methanocorpusculum sp.]|nr:hypothetical protein [Methanocorpusculum sp.]